MNLNLFATIALGALAAAPALAATDASPAQRPAGDAPPEPLQISITIDRIDDLVAFGQPPEPAVIEFARLLRQLPAHSALRARLQQYLDDFASRAERAYVGAHDVAVLRTEILLGRIDSLMDDLERRSAGGQWTAEQFAGVVEAWTYRGRAFVDAPDPDAYRDRFLAAVRQAVDGARSFAGARARLSALVKLERARWAREVLEVRIAEGTAFPADYRRLAQAIRELRAVRRAGGPMPLALD